MFVVRLLKSGIQDRQLFLLLAVSLWLSGFDATATIHHITHGVAVELNPVMRYFLEIGYIQFFSVKVLLTTFGLWICYRMRHLRLGRAGIWLTAGVYHLVMLYHVYIYQTAY